MTTDLRAKIHQYLTTAPSSLFAQQTVEVLDEWEGDANLLWRVRVADTLAVVKLFMDAGQARSRRQFDGHTLFAPIGLAPKPLWADRYPHGLSRQLIVYDWAEGERVQLADMNELEALADAVGTLHASPTSEVRRFSPHPLNLEYFWRIEQASIAQIDQWLASSGLATSELALSATFRRIAAATETVVQASLPRWSMAQPTPIHGDLSAQNTVMTRGRVQLLDWEMFGLGDPAFDVAHLFQTEAQQLTAPQVDAFLAHYAQVVDQPDIVERIHTYQRLLDVHSVVYLLVGLEQNTRGQMDLALRNALPFIQNALTAALDRAHSVLELSPHAPTQQISNEFFEWLTALLPAVPQ